MIEELDIETSATLRLPDNEIVLCFQNDSGAEKFKDWWSLSGKEAFDDYCKENSYLYGE